MYCVCLIFFIFLYLDGQSDIARGLLATKVSSSGSGSGSGGGGGGGGTVMLKDCSKYGKYFKMLKVRYPHFTNNHESILFA